MINFFINNWVDLLLVIVGLSAIAIYLLQERKKETEAASLIVMQIDDLTRKLREISSYIVEKQVNFTAFYESLL